MPEAVRVRLPNSDTVHSRTLTRQSWKYPYKNNALEDTRGILRALEL